ncbi:uncharacterized protein LOC134534587 [Bacillus rossius redtenbacheri]|uniref:uncharacterized protein LOC134534587 n=1 Tax=Bacillus rossius redtenbacheri TaxID=93214 RepID=UPI002FDD8CFE
MTRTARLLAAVLLAAAGAAVPGDTWRRSCAASYTSACLKAEAAAVLERVSREAELQLFPGVRLVRDNSSGGGGGEAPGAAGLAAELARDHPKDVGARLDAFLARRVAAFLAARSVSVRLPDPASLLAAWSGRAKDKGGKGMQLLLAAAGMMKAMLGALGIGAVALLAGKALMAGLLALMLAALVGLKSLAGGGHHHVSYEVVSKPVVSHVDSHSHELVHEHPHHGYAPSSHGRSYDEAPGAAEPEYRPAAPGGSLSPAAEPGGGVAWRQNTYLPLTAPGGDLAAPGT